MFDPSRYWYQSSLHPILFILWPFSKLFGWVSGFRRTLYRFNILKTHRFPTPIIVVGNITVGGAGKTPFVLWLASLLKSQGFRPGIVSRGVGGEYHEKPHWVKPTDLPEIVGDEAILLTKRAECPMIICADRVAAVKTLLQNSDCNIVISDDGLQHYRLGRDVEIAIVDGARRLGNEYLLPAGPLREPPKRLRKVDFVIVNGGNDNDEFVMDLIPSELISLRDGKVLNLTQFSHQKVHAVAAIGHPERFFLLLKKFNINVIAHAFPDHYLFRPHDLDFADSLPVIMTEKDAVKCQAFAKDHYWYLPVTAKMDNRFTEKLIKKISEVNDGTEAISDKHSPTFPQFAKYNQSRPE